VERGGLEALGRRRDEVVPDEILREMQDRVLCRHGVEPMEIRLVARDGERRLRDLQLFNPLLDGQRQLHAPPHADGDERPPLRAPLGDADTAREQAHQQAASETLCG
jgi:hypothetical protein